MASWSDPGNPRPVAWKWVVAPLALTVLGYLATVCAWKDWWAW